MGSPKIPEPTPPPAPPPAPTKVAEEVETPQLRKRDTKSRKRGLSSLTIRRPSVNMGSSGGMTIGGI